MPASRAARLECWHFGMRVAANSRASSAVFDAIRHSRIPMDLSSWPGANRSDALWYREDLQRRRGGEDAALLALACTVEQVLGLPEAMVSIMRISAMQE